jgi:hypothetical protein
MSTPKRNDARVVRVSRTQRASLRRQTWEILDLEHHRFEAFADQPPTAQHASATLFRDALTLLDLLGWETPRDTTAIDLALTAGHIAHLEARRADLTLSIADRLSTHPTNHHNLTDRTALHDLATIIAAFHDPGRP